MPYLKDKPPDRIKALPEHAQAIWIAAFNSAYEQYDKDEAKANATAWNAVEKAGYHKNEKGVWIKESLNEQENDFDCYVSLKESAEMLGTKDDEITRELKENHRIQVVLMKSGIGKTATTVIKDKRLKPYYTPDFVLSSTPIFDNVKMFMNHESKAEKETGERDLKRWIATAVSPTSKVIKDNSTAIIGWADIHDADFESRLLHKSFRDSVGTSINAYGRGYVNKKDDEEVFQASALEKLYSVDFTPEGNFTAGVFKENKSNERSNTMDYKEIKLEDLKTLRADLVEAIVQENSTLKPLSMAALKENYPGLVKEITDSVTKNQDDEIVLMKENIQRLQIKNTLTTTNLPELAKTRITEKVMEKIYTDETALNVALTETIKEMRDFIGQINKTGKVKAYSYAQGDSLTNNYAAMLAGKLGVKKPDEQKT